MINTITDISALYNRAKAAANETEWATIMVDSSRQMGMWVDRKIIEATPEAWDEIDTFITLASAWVITVHLGTQLRNILMTEPKYCKGDVKAMLEHFKQYREQHLANFAAGRIIPTTEYMFLAKDL